MKFCVQFEHLMFKQHLEHLDILWEGSQMCSHDQGRNKEWILSEDVQRVKVPIVFLYVDRYLIEQSAQRDYKGFKFQKGQFKLESKVPSSKRSNEQITEGLWNLQLCF